LILGFPEQKSLPGGYVGARSPDRADAAIRGLSELMLDPEPMPNIRFFSSG
jgi:phage terminase large subunit-like protein